MLSSKVNEVLTVDLKPLNKLVGPAVEYLRSRLDEPVKIKGSQVKLTRTDARTAKLLLHKFLHRHRLEGYRILVVHSELIEVRAREVIRFVLRKRRNRQLGRRSPIYGTLLRRESSAQVREPRERVSV
jgi:hypothetical protein